MSDIPVPPSPAPSQTPYSPQPYTPPAQALGEDPDDRQPLAGLLGQVEGILRHHRRVFFQLNRGGASGVISGLLGATVISALIYGAIVGSFSGGMQLWAAPLKIGLGFLVTGVICLPSLYIFACLSGSRARLIEVIGLLAGLLALTTLLLIGFAPVAWIFSRSTDSLPGMGFLHLLFWLVATLFGLRFVNTGFSHLGIKTSAGIRVWSLIFMLVSLQMTTALRPLIGTSPELISSEKRFFLSHWMRTLDDAGRANRPQTPEPAKEPRP